MTAEIHAWELKGPGDLAAIESIAHAYGSGQDDETIWACLEDLKAIRAELRERLLLELTTKEDASGGPSSRSRWATVALGGGGGGAVRCAAAPLSSLVAYMVTHRRPYEPTFRVLAGPITAKGECLPRSCGPVTAAGRVSPGQTIR